MNLLCLQSILNSKPEGDCHVNNLRRRGQSLCDHADTDEGRKVRAQKAVRDAEEQWRTVLLAAKHVEAAAEAEISQRTESTELEVRTMQRDLLCPRVHFQHVLVHNFLLLCMNTLQ